MSITEQLERFRLENKLPQEALAKKHGVAFSTVNRWFNRQSRPNQIQTYHIEKLLKKLKSRVSKVNRDIKPKKGRNKI